MQIWQKLDEFPVKHYNYISLFAQIKELKHIDSEDTVLDWILIVSVGISQVTGYVRFFRLMQADGTVPDRSTHSELNILYRATVSESNTIGQLKYICWIKTFQNSEGYLCWLDFIFTRMTPLTMKPLTHKLLRSYNVYHGLGQWQLP